MQNKPSAHTLHSFDGDSHPDPMKYRSTVGTLQYVLLTQPDLLFAINEVCQYMNCSTTAY